MIWKHAKPNLLPQNIWQLHVVQMDLQWIIQVTIM